MLASDFMVDQVSRYRIGQAWGVAAYRWKARVGLSRKVGFFGNGVAG